MKIPIPLNASEGLKVFESYSILNSLPEKEYDSITQLASSICETPVALITLLDGEQQWFISSFGLGLAETSKEFSLYQYPFVDNEVYEVPNILENERFFSNPLVTGGPNVRFYAGALLRDADGFNLGSLSVIDTVPRILTDEQKNALKLLANQVVLLMDFTSVHYKLK